MCPIFTFKCYTPQNSFAKGLDIYFKTFEFYFLKNSLNQVIISISFVQSVSYFTHRVPAFKGCAVTLNDVCRSSVKVVLDHAKSPLTDLLG